MFPASSAQSYDSWTNCDDIKLWTNQSSLSTSQVGFLVVNRRSSEPQKAVHSVEAENTLHKAFPRTLCHGPEWHVPGTSDGRKWEDRGQLWSLESVSDFGFLFVLRKRKDNSLWYILEVVGLVVILKSCLAVFDISISYSLRWYLCSLLLLEPISAWDSQRVELSGQKDGMKALRQVRLATICISNLLKISRSSSRKLSLNDFAV